VVGAIHRTEMLRVINSIKTLLRQGEKYRMIVLIYSIKIRQAIVDNIIFAKGKVNIMI
jgi:hypothetical protein